jgi:hypothetical protein
LAGLLGNTNPNRRTHTSDSSGRLDGLGIVHRILSNLPGAQDVFKQTIIQCASTNPRWARTIVMLAAFYLHLGPFSRQVIHQIEQRLDESRNAASDPRGPTRLPDIATVA